MRKLRVAVWGLGQHAIRNIVPALAGSAMTKLIGVCSRNGETVSNVSRKYKCDGWTEPAGMLAERDVDAVFLATPTGLHFPQGREVLCAGKHLWCEKPLAMNLNDAETLVTDASKRRLSVAEGFMFLHYPQFVRLSEIVASGTLGEIQSIDCRFGIPPLSRPGFRNNPALGGGAFLDVACYPVAAVTALMPDRDPAVAFSEIITAAGAAVDTAGWARLRYNHGVSALLNWGTGRAYRNEIDLWGTKGSISTEKIFSKPGDYIPRFRFRNIEGGEVWEDGAAGNHFAIMLDSFANLAADAYAAEREKSLIVRRAGLSEKIRTQSRS